MARRVALAAALASLVGGCGSGDGAAPPPRPAETPDPPAKIDPRWQTELNRVGGFTLGVPPLWKSSAVRGTATQLRSPDHQVAVTISADRTDEALALTPAELAAGTAAHLPGFDALRVAGSPRPYPDHYEAAAVRAHGVSERTGVAERLEVVVLRRDRLAVYTAIAERAARRRSVFAQQVDPIVRSLRGRPVSG